MPDSVCYCFLLQAHQKHRSQILLAIKRSRFSAHFVSKPPVFRLLICLLFIEQFILQWINGENSWRNRSVFSNYMMSMWYEATWFSELIKYIAVKKFDKSRLYYHIIWDFHPCKPVAMWPTLYMLPSVTHHKYLTWLACFPFASLFIWWHQNHLPLHSRITNCHKV